MENIKTAINLLNAVHATMDTISVSGIENQDKFVGCANAIQTVSQTLGKFLQEAEHHVEEQEEADGR
mgnify:CR=1 FL=1